MYMLCETDSPNLKKLHHLINCLIPYIPSNNVIIFNEEIITVQLYDYLWLRHMYMYKQILLICCYIA